MKLAYLAFSDKGHELAERLAEELGGTAFRSGQPQSLAEWTKEHFGSDEGLVFVGAAGIAVRAVAPFVADKATDPAVVVIDEKALNVIPILSGHLGGANDLARRIAGVTGAGCVITTATDINGVFAVDEWSKRQGCRLIEKERIVRVSGALLGGGKVTVRSRWDIEGEAPEGITVAGAKADGTDAEAADVTLDAFSKDKDTLHIVPPVCVLGIGCRKGTKKEAMELLLERLKEETGLLTESVCGAASIDLKKEEEGLLEFCADHGWDIDFYSSDELAEACGDFSGSEMVKSVTGVDNVCERSAVLKAGSAEGALSGAEIAVRKMAGNGVTMAVAMKEYRPDWEWKDE